MVDGENKIVMTGRCALKHANRCTHFMLMDLQKAGTANIFTETSD
jgi:hypothetical protein